jgi:hypothetical protein
LYSILFQAKNPNGRAIRPAQVRFKHRRALVLTARKLVRLVFSLLLKNEPYQLPGGDARA